MGNNLFRPIDLHCEVTGLYRIGPKHWKKYYCIHTHTRSHFSVTLLSVTNPWNFSKMSKTWGMSGGRRKPTKSGVTGYVRFERAKLAAVPIQQRYVSG